MKWKLYDDLVVMIVQEDWQGIGDTDRVVGCVGKDQRHVAEHIVTAHNVMITDLDEAKADIKHWKANHDEMAARNQLLRDRPDLSAEQVAARLGYLKRAEDAETFVMAIKTMAAMMKDHAWLARFRDADYKAHYGYSKLSPSACNDIARYVDQLLDAILKGGPSGKKEGQGTHGAGEVRRTDAQTASDAR